MVINLNTYIRIVFRHDTIFDNKDHYYLKHNYHIFVLHRLSNNITNENMRSHYSHFGRSLNYQLVYSKSILLSFK
jgi:hypothetical protein